uniref:Uncharacterized protein n=1 Tax=viral metagenome TaxID=1070528 RepID=A0A6C0CEA4_9ZZZZ|tara:strand:- start:100 stop:276 length:177 start_codon:yes stop_codon:yes gene_type:complete
MESMRFTRDITNIIKKILIEDETLIKELNKYELKPINSKGCAKKKKKKKKKNKKTKRR